jgi:acetate kinase
MSTRPAWEYSEHAKQANGMIILTLNAGSNSLKFEIIAVEPYRAGGGPPEFGRSLLSGAYDDIGKESSTFSLLEGKRIARKEKVEVRDHGHATELLFHWISSGGAKEHGVAGLDAIERVCHRVVHGADRFEGPAFISDEVLQQIEALSDLAPLHNESALKVIRAAQSRAGYSVPMIAVFDTVFHRELPDEAALYPLPLDLAKRHGIRRYGFHGISHRYLMLRYCQLTRRPISEIRIITLHLEGGSSAAAIRDGKSIDTSMGLTPLEGLMMGTRSGDIDPAIVTYLMRKENMDGDEAERFLNKQCGLLGVSQVSADTRELHEHLAEHAVNLAIDMYCYRVRKYIGAYLAALGGAEAIVFGGGIGENTPYMRERIAGHFAWCGAVLDRRRNEKVIDREDTVSTPDSEIKLWVIPTEEGLMMAQDGADYAMEGGL